MFVARWSQESGNAIIRIIDANGNIVKTENRVLMGGELPNTLLLPSNAAKGLYLVQVTVNNKTYST
jgi:hypothetical protein